MTNKDIKSIKKTLALFEAQLDSVELKDSRRVALLSEISHLQVLIYEDAKNTREDEADAQIAELTQQTAQQASRIATLESENAALRSAKPEVKTVLNPEHAVTLQQNAKLSSALKQVITSMNDTERQVALVRVCQSYSDRGITLDIAREIAAAAQMSFNEQAQMYRDYAAKSDKALEELVEQHESTGTEGGITQFVRALLIVRHGGLVFNVTVASRNPLVDF